MKKNKEEKVLIPSDEVWVKKEEWDFQKEYRQEQIFKLSIFKNNSLFSCFCENNVLYL